MGRRFEETLHLRRKAQERDKPAPESVLHVPGLYLHVTPRTGTDRGTSVRTAKTEKVSLPSVSEDARTWHSPML